MEEVPLIEQGVFVKDWVVCSRETIFGNPFRPMFNRRLRGETLDRYRRWLDLAVQCNSVGEAAREFYRKTTNVTLPDDYHAHVVGLIGKRLYCPGCKWRTGLENICHVSVLLATARRLQGGLHDASDIPRPTAGR